MEMVFQFLLSCIKTAAGDVRNYRMQWYPLHKLETSCGRAQHARSCYFILQVRFETMDSSVNDGVLIFPA